MEEAQNLQSTDSNDEVLIKQKGGSFKLVKISELNNLEPLPAVTTSSAKQMASASKTMSAPPAPVVPPRQSVPTLTQSSQAPIKPAPQPVFAPTVELYDTAAEKLVKESGLNVAPELQQRFKMIVMSRLKEVRKWVETRQKLMSPLESGGMGFAYEQAEKFLKLVDEKKEGLLKNEIASVATPADGAPRSDKKVVATPPPLPPAPSSPVMPLVSKRDSSASPQNDRGTARNDNGEIALVASLPRNDKKVSSNDMRPMPATSSDITKMSPQPLKIVQQEKVAPKVELAPMPLAQIKPAQKIAIPQTPAGRSKMEDVAYRPRLVGPVEELREMTLVDFRRLSPQAKVTADKIYAKIELLAEESYEKKILGIKAWQESEVNKMYLGLLNESVDRAMPVQKMIEERQGTNRPTLTYEEFKTVMELNRRLRN